MIVSPTPTFRGGSVASAKLHASSGTINTPSTSAEHRAHFKIKDNKTILVILDSSTADCRISKESIPADF
jgi:hypothetical protein